MELLPLLVLPSDEPALLPGERRRLLLSEPRATTALRLARRGGGRLAVFAFAPSRLRGWAEDEAVEEERLLELGTAADLLAGETDGTRTWLVLRGAARVRVTGLSSGGCCDHDDPLRDGTEAAVETVEVLHDAEAKDALAELERLLERLDLVPRLRPSPSLERRIDRLARWLCPPAWARGELLAQPDLAGRLARLADHARELSRPGASFRAADLEAAYASEEEHAEDLVHLFDSRARRASLPVAAGDDLAARAEADRLRARRRLAALRERAVRARIAGRLSASERAGRLPALERLRRAHGLRDAEVEALLLAGLGGSERFAERLRHAARLLPPAELPLGAWIAALEQDAFAFAPGPRPA